MKLQIKTNEAGENPATFDEFNCRVINIKDKFYRIDVSKNNLSTIDGCLEPKEIDNYVDCIRTMAKDLSDKDHLISVYHKSEDKYYGPFVGPALPISDIPGLQQALGF